MRHVTILPYQPKKKIMNFFHNAYNDYSQAPFLHSCSFVHNRLFIHFHQFFIHLTVESTTRTLSDLPVLIWGKLIM